MCRECKLKFYILNTLIRKGCGKYCSPRCQQIGKMTGIYKTCQTCKKQFYIPKWAIHLYKYCSINCRNGRTKLNCLRCGKEFIVDNNRIKRGDCKYCSMECVRSVMIKRNCKKCNEEFVIFPYQAKLKQGIYCSHECRGARTSDTNIELLLKEQLDLAGLKYKHPYRFHRYKFDFAFPEIKLAIEADGIFWHTKPEIVERDRCRNKICQDEGWTVLRFTDKQLNRDMDTCMSIIVSTYNRLRKCV